VVQNTPFSGGGLLIAPGARLDDGLLDVVTVGPIGKMDLMMNLPKLYKGNHLKHPQFSLVRCRSLEVRSRQKLPAMFDGDAFGFTPLEITAKKQALRVIVEQQA
jgi:diacylglycerol kinase (ATP)